MATTLEFRQAFVARLKQACDESANVPPPNKGRQKYIANNLEVADEAVSKWFKAVAMPRHNVLEKLAELLNVEQSWLAFGIAPEMDRAERKAHGRELDGAVHLVMGMFMLAGGHCGTPSPRDSRAGFVDFYVTIRGGVHPVHVSLAREVKTGEFEISLPKEFAEVWCIGVIPAGADRYHYIELSSELIERHKSRKSGMFVVTLTNPEGQRYVSGDDTWAKLKSFSTPRY